MNYRLFALIAALLFFVSGVNSYNHSHQKQTVNSAPVQQVKNKTAYVSPELEDAVTKLGIDRSDLAGIYYGKVPAQKLSENSDPLGLYDDATKTIYVGSNSQDKSKVLMHEYIHYLWANGKIDTAKYTTDFNRFYDENPYVKSSFALYINAGYKPHSDDLVQELVAHFCTSEPDMTLRPYVVSDCNAIFDRSVLNLR